MNVPSKFVKRNPFLHAKLAELRRTHHGLAVSSLALVFLSLGITSIFGQVMEERTNVVRWSQLKKTYSVQERKLTNYMRLEIMQSGAGGTFSLESTTGNLRLNQRDPIILDASRSYSGKRFSTGFAMNRLTGKMNLTEPEDVFYAALGMGSIVFLPDSSLTIFGLHFAGGFLAVTDEGVEFGAIGPTIKAGIDTPMLCPRDSILTLLEAGKKEARDNQKAKEQK